MRTISELLLTFLFNACWQIALVAAIAALCARLLRGTTSRYQHLLWVIALAFSFCLPVLICSSLLGDAFFSELPRTMVKPASDGVAPAPQLIPDTQASLPVMWPTAPPTALKEAVPSILINRNVAAAVIVLYALFLFYRSGKLFMAWRRARNLKRSARLIDLPEQVRTTIRECHTALGMNQVRVLLSTSTTVPVAVGSLNPLIILPEHLMGETDRGVLTAAIGHELVHIERRDYLLNLIYELISLPLSFHPVTGFVKRRIRETREIRCDELVTEKLLDAATYARSLIHLARSAVNMNCPKTTITVGIANADILEERVMSILRRPKINTRRKNLLLVTAAFIFIVPCMAAAPFTLRIGINSQAAAVAPENTDAIPRTAVISDQQVDEYEKRVREAKKRLEEAEKRMEARGRILEQVLEDKLKEAQGLDERAAAELRAKIKDWRDREERPHQELDAKIRDAEDRKNRAQAELEAEYLKTARGLTQGVDALDRKKRAQAELETKFLETGLGLMQELEAKITDEIASLVGKERVLAALEAMEKDPEFILRRNMEMKAREQAELAKKANITMQQAIQIAMSQQAGMVAECRLTSNKKGHEKDQVFYILKIVSSDDPEKTPTHMLISAVDGRVVKTWKDEEGRAQPYERGRKP
jgi:bla regulator protein blaR1